jgi:CMP-N,N'-diacetyllegionaminic acid synthase
MKILAVIPARGGSKGINRKNIVLLAGRPLISYTLSCAQSARSLDRVVVSTDDLEIANVCQYFGTEVIMRPASLADDRSTTHSVLLHVVEKYEREGYLPDAVMTLQPTSPLRTAKHIDDAAELFKADPLADSLVSCVEVPHIYNPYSVMRMNSDGYMEPFLRTPQPTRRQDKEVVFARNGAAIYITRRNKLSDFVFGGRLIPYMMDKKDSVDIDSVEDLIEAEQRIQLFSM